MKKFIALISLFVFAMSLTACMSLDSYLNNTVEPTKSDLLLSAMGEFTTEEHYGYGWWQDGGTYSKYTYKSVNINNEYLSPVAESDIKDIKLRVSDFRFWVSSSKDDEADKSLYENYDFDISIIDTNDYWFIEYKKDIRDFDLFIFDTETNVLYRFSYSI